MIDITSMEITDGSRASSIKVQEFVRDKLTFENLKKIGWCVRPDACLFVGPFNHYK